MRLRPAQLIILLTTLLLSGSLTVRSQELRAVLSHYSAEDGMTSNTISDVKTDAYGFIWIASWNGFSRFDGYEFYNYPTGNASGIPLMHNRIAELCIDNGQNVWLRMYDGRVFVLNRKTDTIINPLQDIPGYKSFMTNRRLFANKKGEVFAIIQDQGIYQMVLKDNKVTTRLIKTNDLQVRGIAEGIRGTLWLATNKGFHRMNATDGTIQPTGVFEDEVITCIFSDGPHVYAGTLSGKIIKYTPGLNPQKLAEVQAPISALFVDSQELIWYSLDVQGVSRLNQKTGNIKSFTQDVIVPQLDVKGAVIMEVNNTVWINMNQGGFGYYNREADRVEYFHNDPDDPWNLSNTVHAFMALPEGIVWESTNLRGLEKLELQKNTVVRRQLFENEAGVANEIRAIYYDKERRQLLIGNKDNTLVIISDDGRRTVLDSDNYGNSFGRIYGINKDREGNYWLSSKGNGVIRVTPTGNSFALTFFQHQDGNPNSLNDDNAYYTVEDPEGNIWVGTYGGGINIITRQPNNTYRILNKLNGLHSYPKDSYQKIRTIALDKEGCVWAGTTDGILRMSLKHNKFVCEALENCDDPEHMLGSNDILYLTCDDNGSMWVGTNGGGLSHTIGKDDKGNWMFETFDAQDGLPSEEIRSITFDNRNHVWFASDHNISFFDKQAHIVSTLGTQDGIDNTMCSEAAIHAMPNGDILCGTINGYYYVNHNKLINPQASLLKLNITDFFIDNQIASPRLNKYFDYYVPDSAQVELPSHDSSFSIRFASLNYQLQHRIHYQYMLEGYDEDWKNADRTRMATYDNLPAGTYTFKVKAFLLAAPNNYDLRTIKVTVPPYWLLSPAALWIYLMLLCIGSAVLYYMHKEHVKSQKRKQTLWVGKKNIAFEKKEEFDFMKKQLEWLEQNYQNANMKYEDIIAQSTLGRAAYYNKLETITGMAPKEFVTDFRIKKAQQLLKQDKETPIPEIAAQVGIIDPVYFTRAFKQKTGLTPTQFREGSVER